MALGAPIAWEVRTGGSDANGGGFVTGSTGTDYSQQNSAQFSGTDLASISSLVVASASHNFVSTDVGNLIQITAGTGFTTGFYQIVSVSANQATLDRSPGTVGVGGTWAEGGALATISKVFSNIVAGNIAWIQAGTYTQTSALALPQLTNIRFEGYQTTRGDFGTAPLITTATNSTNLFTSTSSGALAIAWYNVSFSNTAGTPLYGFTAPPSGGPNGILLFYKCTFSGFVSAIIGDYNNFYYFKLVVLLLCELKSCTGSGALWNDGGNYVDDCTIHDNAGAGIFIDHQQTITIGNVFNKTIFYNNQDGIGLPSGATDASMGFSVQNCTFYNQSRDHIRMVAAASLTFSIVDSIFDTAGGYAVNNTSGITQGMALNNAFRANTSGNYNNGLSTASNYFLSLGDISLSASPFTAPGSNFALNSTTGGGTACKGAGINGKDLGAIQSSGGGTTTTYVIAPTINNFIQE